jgi:hypothetical protein
MRSMCRSGLKPGVLYSTGGYADRGSVGGAQGEVGCSDGVPMYDIVETRAIIRL